MVLTGLTQCSVSHQPYSKLQFISDSPRNLGHVRMKDVLNQDLPPRRIRFVNPELPGIRNKEGQGIKIN